MSIEFDSDIVVLSEGLADKNFLEKLVAYWLPSYSVSFPYPTRDLGGVSAFTKMLQGIRGCRVGFEKLKGVLLVADSCDGPASVFTTVTGALTAATRYPIPLALDTIAAAANGHPATAITTIPSSTMVGGLETLYSAFLDANFPAAATEVTTFLNASVFDVTSWNAEKQGKARYASFVAATHRDDPSRSASMALRSPCIIDVTHSVFQPLSDTLRHLFDDLIA